MRVQARHDPSFFVYIVGGVDGQIAHGCISITAPNDTHRINGSGGAKTKMKHRADL